MLTLVVYAVLAVVVVAALVAVAVLVLPGTEQLAPAPADRTPWALPAERAMTGPDVGRLRLPVTLRGYRFAETDAVLDRLGEEIAYRDAVIATLRAELENTAAFGSSDGEVLAAAPVEAPAGSEAAVGSGVDVGSGEDDELVELGETPEETGADPTVVAAAPAVADDEAPAVADDEAPTEAELETHESAAAEAPEAAYPEPRVVALDDDLADVDDADDTPPQGPAPRDHR